MIMRELARLGHKCVVITSDSNQLAEVPLLESPVLIKQRDGLVICWLRTFKYTVAKSWRRIVSWLDFEWRLFLMRKDELPRPEVVVVSSLSLLTVLNGFLLRQRFGCRLVFEIRDIWPLTITEEGGVARWHPVVLGLALVEWLGYRYADLVVGTMPNLAEHVRKILGYTRAVECIPMGFDPDAAAEEMEVPADYLRRYLPGGKFVVAHVGAIGITNALEVFLRCAESLAEVEDIQFLMVGEGDLKARYEAEYGHLSNVTFAPRVPKLMVAAVLARCDLLYFSVHPSEVWRYGQSLNKVIDYMLAGKPVVASYTGFPSMINEAACGTYVPAGDVSALREEVLRYAGMTDEERKAMGARGRAWVQEHRTYASLARQYLGVMFPRVLPKSS